MCLFILLSNPNSGTFERFKRQEQIVAYFKGMGANPSANIFFFFLPVLNFCTSVAMISMFQRTPTKTNSFVTFID